MLRLGKHILPGKVAVIYSVTSLLTSISVSLWEQSFFKLEKTSYSGMVYEIHPFKENYSTLIDFVLLNPLVIYFLLKSFKGNCNVFEKTSSKPKMSPYHLVGMTILALAMTGSFMSFYYKGFLEGEYFDAIIKPITSTEVTVTYTGWVVFFWTALCMFIVLLFSFLHIPYLKFLLSLRSKDLLYIPQHEDNVGGQKLLMRPILDYFYAAFVMLLIFILFQLYDTSDVNIDESNRIYGFFVFVLVAGPILFIPVLHLHKLMMHHRDEYLRTMRNRIGDIYSDLTSGRKKTSSDLDQEIKKFDYVDKYQKLIKNLPAWPLPRMELTLPIVSLIGALLKITQDVFGGG